MSDDKTATAVKTEVAKGEQKKKLYPRMSLWWVVATCFIALAAYLNPANIPVLVWKGALISSAPVIGYWIDRVSFPYGRPDFLLDLYNDGDWQIGEAIVFGAAMFRRAMIMTACIYSVGSAL